MLACGGFEANREWRTRYLGPGWDMAKVRGTRYNTGDGISMALEIGAQSYGQWSGCHSVAWERYAPDFGDVNAPHAGYRHSYPFGIMVNADGRRFVDEGADFRNYTYAKYGRVVLQQPGSFAWQIFDQQVKHLMRDEYQAARCDQGRRPKRSRASSTKCRTCIRRISRHRAGLQRGDQTRGAVRSERQGRPHTVGLAIDKTNWANCLEKPPFEAYSVGCGITFTFGGLKIDTSTTCSIWKMRRSGSVCGGRARRRALFFQLSGQHGTDGRLGVRQNRRTRSGGAFKKLIVIRSRSAIRNLRLV